MLRKLIIQNFALIKELELDVKDNLTVISGETGSGKSLIIKSLKFVLGDRADKSNIRVGEKFLKVQCIFDNLSDFIINELNENGIIFDEDKTIFISRSISVDGKNDIRINGSLVTLSYLNKITKHLTDFYGQSEHFSLLENSKQLDVIDSFCGESVTKAKLDLKNLIFEKNDIINKLSMNFALSSDEKEKKLELLKYEIDELENNNFNDEFEQELKDKKLKFLSFEKIKTKIENAYSILNNGFNNSSLSNALKEVSNELKSIKDFDAEYETILDKADSLRFELEDLQFQVSNLNNNLYNEVDDINVIESQLDLVSSLKRKYGSTFSERNEYLEKSKNEFNYILNNDKIVNELNDKLNRINDKIQDVCKSIYDIREKSIKQIENGIISNLKDLDMKDADFKINHILNDDINHLTYNGLDSVEFLFSSNIGQPLMPLSKIISGGELSRFMLAYKNVIMQKDSISLLILDEIDTGISGNVAQKVAYKISDISKICQIISISHLPQLASIADNNVVVFKKSLNGQTYTIANYLEGEDVYYEIARLSGSNEINELDLEYAKVLRSNSIKYKNK